MNPRAFVPFFVGRVLSTLGRQMLAVAVGWDLYERTSSFLVLGLVGAAQVLPVILLAVPSGHAVDRFDARRMGALASALIGVTGVALAAATYEGAPVPAILALLAVHGAGVGLLAPSASSVLPRIVALEERARANAVMSTGFELASIGGPGLAGGLLALTKSAPLVFLIHAALSLAFGVILAVLRARGIGAPERAGAPASASSSWSSMAAGVRFVFSSRLLLPAMTLDLFAVLFGGVTALLPAFARDVLHAGPEGLGALRAAPAVGALAMALISTRLPPWKRPGRALFVAIGFFAASTLAFALSDVLWLSIVCLGISGAADNVSVVIRMTLEQMVTPDDMRGRVSAVRYVFIGMSNELGELESGLAAALLGLVPSVVVGVTVSLVVVVVVLARWPDLGRLGPLAALRPDKLRTDG